MQTGQYYSGKFDIFHVILEKLVHFMKIHDNFYENTVKLVQHYSEKFDIL